MAIQIRGCEFLLESRSFWDDGWRFTMRMMSEVYEALVELRFQEFDGEPLNNGRIEHAATIAKFIARSAKNNLKIFAGVLNARVYGTDDFISEVRSFLSVKGRKVQILLENQEDIDQADHTFFREFSDNDDVEFFRFSEEEKGLSEEEKGRSVPKYHFMVADGISYRFEEDKNVPNAVAAFGDPTGGKKLSEKFDDLLKKASQFKVCQVTH